MEKDKGKSAKRPWTSSIDHDPGDIGDLLSGIEDGDAEARRVNDMLGFDPAALPVIDRGTIAGHPLSDKQTWQIVLANGRTISLETLYQYHVYAGVLCGAPRDVDSELTNAVKRARRIFPNHDGKPVVLPPIVYGGSFADRDGNDTPGTPWRIVPKVCCIAEFECGKPARDPGRVLFVAGRNMVSGEAWPAGGCPHARSDQEHRLEKRRIRLDAVTDCARCNYPKRQCGDQARPRR